MSDVKKIIEDFETVYREMCALDDGIPSGLFVSGELGSALAGEAIKEGLIEASKNISASLCELAKAQTSPEVVGSAENILRLKVLIRDAYDALSLGIPIDYEPYKVISDELHAQRMKDGKNES